jgi:hypothetical protein
MLAEQMELALAAPARRPLLAGVAARKLGGK